ncbi:MAG: aminoacetone oxidase family FAD-binding enzyme [Deltaproteobacteria bacterium]|jgi:predicted Rossmann fold flavoprotein|nr:aminoacetone oxidase family FAD-binding enzyme [Deltaproteobacteria bacterium]
MPHHDVIVIGGGAAGMFAAGCAARQGADVLLLEKNHVCGAKILLTGKGRCNVTSYQTDPQSFVKAFGQKGRALLTALYTFGVNETMAFFENMGVELQVERGQRVFPKTGDARSVQQALVTFVRQSGVKVMTDCPVRELMVSNHRVRSVIGPKGALTSTSVILATGGLSYPETGCTGDGFAWASACGHQLVPAEPALMPVRLGAKWTGRVSRFNLKNVSISVWADGQKADERFGEAFFTKLGIGGPIILDMSNTIRSLLQKGPVRLQIDFKPAVSEDLFDKRLQRELTAHANHAFANSLENLLPRDLIPVFLTLSEIDVNKKCHSVTREERRRLLRLFKALDLEVTGCEGFSRAIITAGGVSLHDIDMRTMRSKKVENLFFAGEMIDIDGPTGGYNLQVCWSTGYLAGVNAAPCQTGSTKT